MTEIQESAPRSAEDQALDEFLDRLQGLPRLKAEAVLRELDPQFQQDLLDRLARRYGVERQVAQIAAAADKGWSPATDDDLWELWRDEMGIKVPRKAVCPGHRAPFEFGADVYFERGNPDKMAVGNRGSGKSQIMGAVHATNVRTKRQHSGLTVGAIENQAKRVYAFFRAIVTKPDWERFVPKRDVKMGATTSLLGADVSIVTGTISKVNSPHPNLAHIDEVELLRPGVYDEAMNMAQTSTVTLPDGSVQRHRAMNVLTSSWKKPTGMVTERMREAEQSLRDGVEPEYEIYRWCVWETTEPCPHDCDACPFANVVKGTWPDGSPRTFESACKTHSPVEGTGKLKHTDGFIAVEDTVRRFRRLPRRVWESQQESKRPSLEGLVYDVYDEELHAVDMWLPDPALGPVTCGLDFGGTVPFACTFWQNVQHAVDHERLDGTVVRVPVGADVCFDEVYQEDITAVKFGTLINERRSHWESVFPEFTVERFFADPAAAADRRQLHTLSQLPLDLGGGDSDSAWRYRDIPTSARGGIKVDSRIGLVYSMMSDGLVRIDRMRCENTCNELGGYEWAKQGVPRKEDDHAMDSMGYRFANVYAARLGHYGPERGSNEAVQLHRRPRAVSPNRAGELEFDPEAAMAAMPIADQMDRVVAFSSRRRSRWPN